MNLLSKKSLLNMIVKLLSILIFLKVLSLGALWFLPSQGVSVAKSMSVTPVYHRFNVENILHKPKKEVKQALVQNTTTVESLGDGEEIIEGEKISNMILKGVYKKKKGSLAIVALKSNAKKSEVIGVGEIFSGYKLIQVHKTAVVFVKGGQNYILSMEKKKTAQANSIRRKPKNEPKQTVNYDSDEPLPVQRKDIEHYAKNFKQIWKDISIKELKEGGKLKGFKVTRIKKGTVFERLGLRKNDVIIKANNKVIKTYNDAIQIYKNIDKLDAISIVVLRDNQEKEIIYEIN